MREADTLQLFDPAIADEILFAEVDDLYAFVLRNLDYLGSLKRFDFGTMYALRYGMEHFKKCFYRDYNESDATVQQKLINDLAFTGEPIQMTYWSRCGYFDHPSSTKVKTGYSVVPKWPETWEAADYSSTFDLLEADHVALIAEAMLKNRRQIPAEKQLDRLKVLTMEKTLRANPGLRAAYLYGETVRSEPSPAIP